METMKDTEKTCPVCGVLSDTRLWKEAAEELEDAAIRGFVVRVNWRAEDEMQRTGTLEGAHHRAIVAEQATLGRLHKDRKATG